MYRSTRFTLPLLPLLLTACESHVPRHGEQPRPATGRAHATAPTLLADIDTRPRLFPVVRSALTLPSGVTLLVAGDELNGFAEEGVGAGTEPWRWDGTPGGAVPLKDIFPGRQGASLRHLTLVGDTVYFTAQSDLLESALWKTDGTAEGTVPVLRFPHSFEDTSSIRGVGVLGTTVYFMKGRQLWKTDGTEENASLVKDFGPDGHFAGDELVSANGVLFFRAAGNNSGYPELWRTDGTEAGTVRLHEPGPDGNGSVGTLAALGSGAYFLTWDGRLFRSDGTVEGTLLIRTLEGDSGFAEGLTAFRGALYFRSGQGLWRSNGTRAGTVLLRDIPALSNEPFVASGGVLYFAQRGQTQALWKTDGTAEGTVSVHAFTATGSGQNAYLGDLQPWGDGGAAFVTLREGTAGVWVTPGTPDSALRLKDWAGVRDEYELRKHTALVAARGQLLFSVPGADDRRPEPWGSDGTVAGTRRMEVPGGTRGSDPLLLTRAGTQAFFFASDDTGSRALWTTDGTPEGTRRVRSFASPGQTVSLSSRPAAVGGTFYFVVADGTSGAEVWKSDGTEAGTALLKDIAPGAAGSSPEALAALGGTLFFTADDGVHGPELWKSDGTADGTVLVKDLHPENEASVSWLTPVGSTLFFTANDGVHGTELWKSDGTADGTTLVADLSSDAASHRAPTALVEGGGALFFSMPREDIDDLHQQWRSDGTAAGTVPLGGDGPPWAVLDENDVLPRWVEGTLYLSAMGTQTAYDAEPWLMDATSGEARRLKDLNVGRQPSLPRHFTRTATGVTFFAYTPERGFEPWNTDGTEAGTVPLPEVRAGGRGGLGQSLSGSAELLVDNVLALEDRGLLLFTGVDDAAGAELWMTDGQADGTMRVVDGVPGVLSSDPAGLLRLGERLLYVASDAAHGLELYAMPLPTVRNDTVPTVSCPEDVTASAPTQEGTPVEYPAATARDTEGPPEVTYSTPSGSRFPVGTTPVTVTARDASGNEARCEFTMTVSQASPPPPAPETGGDEDSGCGCSGGSAAASAPWALAALAWVLRRRRAA